MAKKMTFILMLLAGFSFQDLAAQSVITFSGGTMENASMSLSFSAGEAVSGSFDGEAISLISGFSNGSGLVPTANEDPGQDLPDKFKLNQNYPNPFNPSTNISYELPRSSDVRLEIFNSIGAKVATLVEARKPAGSHTVRFDARSLASGMYFYRLTVSGKILSTKKMILIK